VRRTLAFFSALVALLVGALPVAAQESYPPSYPPTPYPPSGGDPGVAGAGGAGGSELAFTGADLALWASVALALIALGLTLFWLRRRHLAGAS